MLPLGTVSRETIQTQVPAASTVEDITITGTKINYFDFFLLFWTYYFLVIFCSGRRTLVKYGTTYVAELTSVPADSSVV